MLFSRAILRTNGDSGPAVSSTALATGAVGGSGRGAATADSDGSDVAAAGAPELAPSLILPTTVLIPTVFPSSTMISASVPSLGDGISVSTLSVEISNSGSSRST